MEKFIIKTQHKIDLKQVTRDLEFILQLYPWPKGNQIGLRYREGKDMWQDSHGSIRNKDGVRLAQEKEFSLWNPFTPNYIKECFIKLAEQESEQFGRIRIMRLLPKTGLTVHSDETYRYHLVIETNPNSYFFQVPQDNSPIGYHVPADSYFYKVDTTQSHFVYNGGTTERIHIVACVL